MKYGRAWVGLTGFGPGRSRYDLGAISVGFPGLPRDTLAPSWQSKPARPALRASPPAEIWDLDALRIPAPSGRLYDILPDERLLMVQRGEGEDELVRFEVVLHSFDEVK